MKIARDFVLGWRLFIYPREILFLSACPCGCGQWIIKFRGEELAVRKKTYSRLKRLKEMA